MILSAGNKYSVRDLLRDVINNSNEMHHIR